MTTEATTEAGSEQDLSVEEKIQQLRELFIDVPEVGKKALENVLSRLASDASQKPRPPVASACKLAGAEDVGTVHDMRSRSWTTTRGFSSQPPMTATGTPTSTTRDEDP